MHLLRTISLLLNVAKACAVCAESTFIVLLIV